MMKFELGLEEPDPKRACLEKALAAGANKDDPVFKEASNCREGRRGSLTVAVGCGEPHLRLPETSSELEGFLS